ncbi:P-loop containing nucleoside triphosphate hydrolase protein [Hygrophoropsis aurantiaca]|uniref:P-loop containing nucleoside triphosphate hydrolase protein n=1 Tax=Hygrophoropsis aurantiaca TaxID=72124 RepID=A0ACB7ZVF4_9AGAM|nr:P-loop containing nucleoside triphosphate hydrolase protein [Hygrophoropsis aurantiaca]
MGKGKWKGKEQRPYDTPINPAEVQASDLIILVMGQTGAGKSTFINTTVRQPDATLVGHDLESCTTKIKHVIITNPNNPGQRVVFIDTPGFDSTYEDDSEILRRIVVWMARSYSDDKTVTGVVYLHEITQTRKLSALHKNLTMFQKLCGDEGLKNVVLVTTKWSSLRDEKSGERREEQLKGGFWKDMIDQGSKIARFHDTCESARDIVNPILKEDQSTVLHIQRELVELEKFLPQTEASIALRSTLSDLVETHKKTISQLRSKTGRQEREELHENLRDTEKELYSLLKQVRDLLNWIKPSRVNGLKAKYEEMTDVVDEMDQLVSNNHIHAVVRKHLETKRCSSQDLALADDEN